MLAPGDPRIPLLSPDILPSNSAPGALSGPWPLLACVPILCLQLLGPFSWDPSCSWPQSDLVCDQRYSDIKPSTEGEVTPRGRGFGPWGEARGSGLLFFSQVIFKVLDPGTLVEYPNNPKIQGSRPHSQSCTPCMLGQPDTGGRGGPA